jgi:hypothetical protein
MAIDVAGHELLSEQAKAKPDITEWAELAIDVLGLRELELTAGSDDEAAAQRFVARQVNMLVASPHDFSTLYSESRGPFSKSFREGTMPIDALAWQGAQMLLRKTNGDPYLDLRSARG